MSGLDLLQQIISSVLGSGFKFPEKISANHNKISIELSLIKAEKTITYKGPVIVVDASSSQGEEIAKKVFSSAEQLQKKNERIAESDFANLISDTEPYVDGSKEEQELLNKFKPFVPQKDIAIISGALFIRKLYKVNTNVERYKSLLIQKYGSRGNNIAKLVSSDYYQDYLLPLYEYLRQTEGKLAKDIFSEIYEEAVTQYPFAVFVSTRQKYEQIKLEVTEKIQLNLLNNQHILNIHGIGKENKKTILKLLEDKDIKRFYMSEFDVVVLDRTVYARIYF